MNSRTTSHFKKIAIWAAGLGLIAVLGGCAGKAAKSDCGCGCDDKKAADTSSGAASCSKDADNSANPPVFRYLASEEGDYQSGYQPDRVVAEQKLQQIESKIPDASETTKYIEYLSVMDNTGRSGDAEKAIKAYLTSNPSEKRAVFLLAVHYMRHQKKELAGYFFAQLEKDSSFQWKSLLYNNLAMLALQEKNRILAIEYLEKATKATPPTAAPFVNLGALYLQSRSYTDAERVFTRGLQLDSDFEDAALGLGSALEGQAKFEQAHHVYSEFIATHPNAMSVLYNDAIILGNRLKQREEAAQVMLRYIQRNGKETAKAHEIIQGWR